MNQDVTNYIDIAVDWQKQNLQTFRDLIHRILPEVKEDFKWNVPVFLINDKLMCAMSTFKNHTKYNFFHGADLLDEFKLFNSGLDSKSHRSINIQDGDVVNQNHLEALIKQAAERLT